jgi:hypothetical protein
VELLNYLDLLESENIAKVYRNESNRWLMGLNTALSEIVDDEFFVVSDADIIVPPVRDSICWLDRMLFQMRENPVIGKLGLSLDLGYIKLRPYFSSTYAAEARYHEGKQIGGNFIAPVDSTLAIYRSDFFVFGLPVKFYPGHGLLGRPNYYVCRIGMGLLAKHIGWRNYLNRGGNDRYKIEKVMCFAKYGAYVDRVFLQSVPLWARWFYYSVRPISRLAWGLRTYLFLARWFFKNSPYSLNHIQYSNR